MELKLSQHDSCSFFTKDSPLGELISVFFVTFPTSTDTRYSKVLFVTDDEVAARYFKSQTLGYWGQTGDIKEGKVIRTSSGHWVKVETLPSVLDETDESYAEIKQKVAAFAEAEKVEDLKSSALAKLTEEERKALGL